MLSLHLMHRLPLRFIIFPTVELKSIMLITYMKLFQVDLYLLPQAAFPTGGLYFKNKTWVKETKGMHVIIHNNYIVGFEKKIKRFKEYDLWLVDDHASESPLGNIS